MDTFVGGVVVTLVVVAVFWLGLNLRRTTPVRDTRISSNIEQLRAIGQLSVYRVRIQEIVTETDHSWGEFGKRYLRWVLSSKKMAMIFAFDIDFVYNLQSPSFRIDQPGESPCRVTMPPCDYRVSIRDIRFYDEQGAKFLPWLLPDLLNGFLGDRFSVEDKNKLVESAKRHTGEQAVKLIQDLQSEVQASAESTLRSISRAFGVAEVDFRFGTETPTAVDVSVSDALVTA
jgi:hypothetical protein